MKIEDINHIFRDCVGVSRIWFGSQLGFKFQDHSDIDFAKWLVHMINNGKVSDITQIAAIIYDIWFARNQEVFENVDMPEERIIEGAVNNIYDYRFEVNQQDLSAHPNRTCNYLPLDLEFV